LRPEICMPSRGAMCCICHHLIAIQKGKRVDFGPGFYIGFIVVLYARER